MSNFYDVLGVKNDANETELKKAYRSLSLKHHPDRGGDKTKFQEINEAYETLSDPSKKQQYDAQLNGFPGGGHHFNMHQGGDAEFSDINHIFNMMFGGAGGPGGMFGGMQGNPDIHVFHNGVPVGGPGLMFQNLHRPPSIIKNLKISIEQAYTGVSIPIECERWVMHPNNIKINETETIYITIPPGIDENEMIILKDKGHVLNENIKGDIKLILQIENNTQFKRQGLDIILKKTITLKEALCGFVFDIHHLNGKILSLNNKTNRTIITPLYKKIVPNMGMIRENNIGNMIIEFEIDFPISLTEETILKLSEIL
jgi:DnaJ-class molecular chaperone